MGRRVAAGLCLRRRRAVIEAEGMEPDVSGGFRRDLGRGTGRLGDNGSGARGGQRHMRAQAQRAMPSRSELRVQVQVGGLE